MGAEWTWLQGYEQGLAKAPELLERAWQWLYIAALASAVLALLSWLAPGLGRRPRGRVLVVMGPGDTAASLGEQAAAAVLDAGRLGLPVAVERGAATVRRADYTVRLAAPGGGVDLGLKIAEETQGLADGGRGLLVLDVAQDCLVAEWNSANPLAQVCAQDCLVAANGVHGKPGKLLRVLESRQAATLMFRPAPTCRSGHALRLTDAQGACDGCGRAVSSPAPVAHCDACQFLLCDACAPRAARPGAQPRAPAAGDAGGALRRHARWRLASEALAVARWAVALWVLRTADVALALSGGSSVWVWDASAPLAPSCTLGALVGVALAMFAAECATRTAIRAYAPRLAVGAALLLVAGGATLFALAYLGWLRAEVPGATRWPGGLEWLGDEALRRWDLAACDTPARCRAAAFAASCGQTLIIGGVNLALFAAGALCCPRAVRARPWLASLLVGTLLLAGAAARFVGLALAGGELELPETEFLFPAVVFGLLQTVARCGAPLLALLAAGSRRGVAKGWRLPL